MDLQEALTGISTVKPPHSRAMWCANSHITLQSLCISPFWSELRICGDASLRKYSKLLSWSLGSLSIEHLLSLKVEAFQQSSLLSSGGRNVAHLMQQYRTPWDRDITARDKKATEPTWFHLALVELQDKKFKAQLISGFWRTYLVIKDFRSSL